MRTFEVIRTADASGVSGVGKVAEGVVFENGECVLRWCTSHAPSSFAFFNAHDDFLFIHCYSHPGNGTKIVYDDGEELEVP